MKPLRRISEQDLDRLFSGKAPAEDSGLADLARLVDRGRSIYLTTIEPDVEAEHLTGLMQVVNLTDKGDLAARPASNVHGPHAQASGLPKPRRRFMLESLFATLSAKIAAGGIAVAMAATGGLAATGSLPDEAQTAVSQALDNIGIDIPLGETAEEALKRAEEAAADALERAEAAARAAKENADDVVNEVDGDQGGEPNENAAFGQSVAEDARDGGVDGQEISERARAQAQERRAAGQANRPEDVPPADAGAPDNAGPPADAGSQSQSGLEKAGDTPAGGHIPSSVPGGPDTADQYRPEGTP
jgi:hypothetical protein